MMDHLMDIATQQLVTIARATAYRCDEQHEYMNGAGGTDWFPHKWVVEAMRAAVTIRNTQAEDMVREELHQTRAQLAERDALLREIHDGTLSGYARYSKIEAVLSASAEPSVPKCCAPTAEELALLAAGEHTPEELWGGSRPTCPKCIKAEPSAPTEIDERAEIKLDQVLRAYEYAEGHPHRYLRGTTNWCAAVAHSLNEQARAALAHKP